jgi:hypothetical protein
MKLHVNGDSAERMSVVAEVRSPCRPPAHGRNATAAPVLASSAGRRASGCAHSSQSSWAASAKTLV